MRPSEATKEPISFNIKHNVKGKKYTFEIDVQYRKYTDNASPANGTWYHIKYKGIQLKNFSVPLRGTIPGFVSKATIVEDAKNTIDLKASMVESQIQKINESSKPSKHNAIPKCSNCGDAMYQAGHKTWRCTTCGETEYRG